MSPMSDTEREARAEKRAKARRDARIAKVLNALSPTTRKTSKQLSDETGYSVPLVRSTINMIRRHDEDRNGQAISYDPSTHEYWIATAWKNDQDAFIEWLRKHLTTRAYNLTEFLEVANGRASTLHGQVPRELMTAIQMVDLAVQALELVAPTPVEKPALKATRPPELHG